MTGDTDVFDALANDDRRQLLIELVSHAPLYVPPLSGASREIATADEELLCKHLSSGRTLAGVNEELLDVHHVHLPMLADYGFVEWDRANHVVTPGPRFDHVRPILELLYDRRETEPIVTARR